MYFKVTSVNLFTIQLQYRSLKPEEKSFGVGIHELAARVFGKKSCNTLQKHT